VINELEQRRHAVERRGRASRGRNRGPVHGGLSRIKP
jgi:hypothetical protein